MEDINVRPALDSDLDQILEVFRKGVWGTLKDSYTKEECAAWAASADNEDRWRTKVEGQYFIVAQHCNEIVGFGSLELNNCIDLLYVAPNHQKKGVANRLLTHLEKKALAEQSSAQVVISTHASKAARAFFLKRGYIELSQNKVMRKGHTLTNYLLEKCLTDK